MQATDRIMINPLLLRLHSDSDLICSNHILSPLHDHAQRHQHHQHLGGAAQRQRHHPKHHHRLQQRAPREQPAAHGHLWLLSTSDGRGIQYSCIKLKNKTNRLMSATRATQMLYTTRELYDGRTLLSFHTPCVRGMREYSECFEILYPTFAETLHFVKMQPS